MPSFHFVSQSEPVFIASLESSFLGWRKDLRLEILITVRQSHLTVFSDSPRLSQLLEVDLSAPVEAALARSFPADVTISSTVHHLDSSLP